MSIFAIFLQYIGADEFGSYEKSGEKKERNNTICIFS